MRLPAAGCRAANEKSRADSHLQDRREASFYKRARFQTRRNTGFVATQPVKSTSLNDALLRHDRHEMKPKTRAPVSQIHAPPNPDPIQPMIANATITAQTTPVNSARKIVYIRPAARSTVFNDTPMTV